MVRRSTIKTNKRHKRVNITESNKRQEAVENLDHSNHERAWFQLRERERFNIFYENNKKTSS